MSYLQYPQQLMAQIVEEEMEAIQQAAEMIAQQILENEIVHIYGPGGILISQLKKYFFEQVD